jgi:RNA polymerase sigma-70 factor, ECF subfamily
MIGIHRLDTFADIRIGQPADRRQHREAFVADTYREIEAEIPRLRRYARALTRDVVAADDLVQDCLTRALGKLHLWQRGTDLRAWLFTILHNQYVNHVRRAVREGAAVGLSDNEPLLTRAPQQGQRLELRDLDRAIAKLPEEQRSAILLVGLEGMRYEEVAAILDVPVGTIRSRLSRGREALRRLMGFEPARDPKPRSEIPDQAASRPGACSVPRGGPRSRLIGHAWHRGYGRRARRGRSIQPVRPSG